ncbi:DNA gyrase inhibitor YacG [Maritimibacter sp. UBA3975]|uniref:DNA gyrase inhibitor YacG n=1 Tax=Maritimibacter sp. UBA3975 TaxID=1946833 RepID=UPI000C0ADD4E|nr:DNA gyrase inhibitor YacG [Maritimibacter sp. UBA3975]MAM59873.1 DNA gyrase inhibitor YacG [Maritimibacter sp.]|tara:strand:- start:13006 stop:13200 length:195 start_codon:yes stop_codon:yes gene_type:complete
MTCPICAKDSDPKYRPFCSRRCADVDLGKWLNGSYRVASEDPDDIEDLIEEMERELSKESPKPH